MVAAWEGSPAAPLFRTRFRPAGVSLRVESDDRRFLDEVALTLGESESQDEAAAPVELRARVRTRHGPDGVGWLRLSGGGETVNSPDDFQLGFSAPEFLFKPVESPDPDWTIVAFRHEPTPLFWLNGEHCLFRLGPEWRTHVALFLFNRLLRARPDLIFFHASAVGVRGRGIMLVGHRGAGKSTTALALAVRGHAFLSDDTACYRPASGELIPFRRSVGIRPGPRARAVDRAVMGLNGAGQRDGAVRLHVDALLTTPAPAPAPLAAVLFLSGFAPEPRLLPVVPGREEVGQLQPFAGSLVNAPATRRVFEMARLLSTTRVYRLHPGGPDETAALLEEVFSAP